MVSSRKRGFRCYAFSETGSFRFHFSHARLLEAEVADSLRGLALPSTIELVLREREKASPAPEKPLVQTAPPVQEEEEEEEEVLLPVASLRARQEALLKRVASLAAASPLAEAALAASPGRVALALQVASPCSRWRAKVSRSAFEMASRP